MQCLQQCIILTLALVPYFATFTSGGGGGVRPPGDWPLIVVKLREKKTVDASRRGYAIANIVLSPRSTFDLVGSGHKSNFNEKLHF